MTSAGFKRVAELKSVLLEAEDVESLLVEIAVELMPVASKAALVQVSPHRRYGCHYLHILKMVVNHQPQVFVHGKHRHRIQVGQHVIIYRILLLLRIGMAVHCLDVFLVENLYGHHQHVSIDDHSHSWRGVQQQVGRLKRLAQVGCHRHTALYHIGLVNHVCLILGYARKR